MAHHEGDHRTVPCDKTADEDSGECSPSFNGALPPYAVHTPVAHVLADKLSRIYMPGAAGKADRSVHPALAEAERTEVPVRDDSWYLVK